MWVRREKLSLMCVIDVFSPQAWDPRIYKCVKVVRYTTKCISKVKEPWSSGVTSANAMPTLVINSQVVLMLRLICHDERVYEEIIPLCKTRLSIQVDYTFLHKITGLVQNLPKATINLSTKKKLSLWNFSLRLDFSFNLIKLPGKQKWRKCFQK